MTTCEAHKLTPTPRRKRGLSVAGTASRHVFLDPHSRRCVRQCLLLDALLFRGALLLYEHALPALCRAALGVIHSAAVDNHGVLPQTSFKKAVAKIAGTTPANIDLVITAARRASHGGGKIKVATTIRAPSAKRLTEVGDVCAPRVRVPMCLRVSRVRVPMCLRVSACVRVCNCRVRVREASDHVPFMT